MFRSLLLILSLSAAAYAQVDTAWTFRYGPMTGTNYEPLATFVDSMSASGGVYVVGWAEKQTGEIDALLLKISTSGQYLWAKTYPNMTAWGIAMDTSGNVYIAGITNGSTAVSAF